MIDPPRCRLPRRQGSIHMAHSPADRRTETTCQNAEAASFAIWSSISDIRTIVSRTITVSARAQRVIDRRIEAIGYPYDLRAVTERRTARGVKPPAIAIAFSHAHARQHSPLLTAPRDLAHDVERGR